MFKLQPSQLLVLGSLPNPVQLALALPRKGLLQCGAGRNAKGHAKAMLPGRSMWSSDDYEDPNSNLWSSSSSAAMPNGVSVAQLPLSQQSLNMAFHVLDKDQDGLISAAEAYKMVAFYLALQDHKPAATAAAAERPLSWDQHLLASISSANKLAGARWADKADALEAFVASKMAGGLQKSPPRCSDLVWAGLGMGLTMLVLGVLVSAVKAWPVVGPWHQHGLPVLLGSFGTFAILLFGKPEAEAVRLWPLIGGQLGATAIAVSILKLWGASLWSRAAAMAATVAYMMWTDTIHPPGGALVLMAMGDSTIQQFGWLYMLWPSLLLCLAVMLPISAATNWLRRNRQFDWPGSAAAASSLHKKQQEWQQQQQQKKDQLMQRSAAIVLSDRMTLHRQVPMSSRFIAALQRMLEAQHRQQTLEQQQREVLEGKEGKPQPQGEAFKQTMEHLRQRMITPQPRSPEGSGGGAPPDNHPDQQQGQEQQQQQMRSMSPSANFIRSSRSPASAAKLDEAVRRRLRREADRKLEDEEHREALWGPALPGVKEFERKLQNLHEKRLKQQQPAQQHFGQAVCGTGLDGVLSSTGESYEERKQSQQHLWQQRGTEGARKRPAWMYRWRSDISTKPGVADFDSFAPDGN